MTGQGVTFVVMPLISLIEDNLTFVKDLGIRACSLSPGSASNHHMPVSRLFNQIRDLRFKIVYVTPEMLAKSAALKQVLAELYK